jgi:hypothetical protein
MRPATVFDRQLALAPAGAKLALGQPLQLRVSLLLGCAIALVATLVLSRPAPYLSADRELARLLRAMAIIKGLLVLGGLIAVWWRFGRPIAWRVAVSYALGCCLLVAATTLVWQLSLVGPAAIAFHATVIALLLLALHEQRAGWIARPSRWRRSRG